MTTGKLIPIEAIEDKIRRVDAEIASLEGALHGVKTDIIERHEYRGWLESVLELAVEPEPGAPPVPAARKRLPPTEAVIDLVRREPGLPRPVVYDKLENEIDTVSGNVRHLLRNTIYSLLKRGAIEVAGDDNRLYPKGGAPNPNGGAAAPLLISAVWSTTDKATEPEGEHR